MKMDDLLNTVTIRIDRNIYDRLTIVAEYIGESKAHVASRLLAKVLLPEESEMYKRYIEEEERTRMRKRRRYRKNRKRKKK